MTLPLPLTLTLTLALTLALTLTTPYLQGLLTKLHGLLLRDVRRVQEQAVTAVASVADVAEDYFAPFYDAFMPGLKGLLQSAQGKDYRMLRGKATPRNSNPNPSP